VTVRFVEEAQREFLEAISHYEKARVGLGRRFKGEVDRCILRIADHPEISHLRADAYRRINLRVFPYHIPYIVRGQTLWVLAVAHNKRKPLYWISRRNEAS
jgi:plasmid stabilization system protein ParE